MKGFSRSLHKYAGRVLAMSVEDYEPQDGHKNCHRDTRPDSLTGDTKEITTQG